MPEMTAEALRRSRDDPDAFGVFYDAYFRDVLTYLTRRSGDADTGLDLAAETFAQAYLSRARFRGSSDGEAAGWLYRIAKRQLARYIKKGRLEQRALERLGVARPELDSESEQQIEQFAELDEIRATLRVELNELPADHRAAVQLRVVDELPYREVARRLAISEPAARARVSRALKALADGLDRSQIRKEIPT